jgi:hypothetical protein
MCGASATALDLIKHMQTICSLFCSKYYVETPKAICDSHPMMSPEYIKLYVYKFTDGLFLTENEKHIILSDEENIHYLTITKHNDKFKILLKTGFNQKYLRRIDFKIYFKKTVDMGQLGCEILAYAGKKNLMQFYTKSFDSDIFNKLTSVTIHFFVKKQNYPFDLFTMCQHNAVC